MLCKERSVLAENFYWLGVRFFLLLFHLDDVIVQIADSFL